METNKLMAYLGERVTVYLTDGRLYTGILYYTDGYYLIKMSTGLSPLFRGYHVRSLKRSLKDEEQHKG